MRKECAEGRKAYNGGQEAIRERSFQCFSSLAFFWDHVTDRLSFSWAYAPNRKQ